MKNTVLGIFALVVVLVSSCLEDPEEQRTLIGIEQYLSTDLNGDQFVKSDTGIYYRIIDQGDTTQYADSTDILVSNVVLKGLDDKLYYDYTITGPWHRKLEESRILTKGMLDAYQLIPIGGEIEALIPFDLAYDVEGWSDAGISSYEDLYMSIEHLRAKLTIEEYIIEKELGDFETLTVDSLPDVTMYYQILEEGTGDFPTDGSTIRINYTGQLFNSEKAFDESIEKDPFEMVLGDTPVILGWQIGIKQFREGSSGILLIPYEMAYNELGTQDALPPTVPPYESLRFDIEILSVE